MMLTSALIIPQSRTCLPPAILRSEKSKISLITGWSVGHHRTLRQNKPLDGDRQQTSFFESEHLLQF